MYTEVYCNIRGGAPREAFQKYTSKTTSTSPCLNFFKRSSQAAYSFVIDSSFEPDTLTWASLSWTQNPSQADAHRESSTDGEASGQ